MAKDIRNATKLMSLAGTYDTRLQNINVSDVTVSDKNLIELTDWQVEIIQGFSAMDVPNTVFLIMNSKIQNISDISITNWLKAFEIYSRSDIGNLENAALVSNGNSDVLTGGAILIQDSTAVVSKSVFRNNRAFTGAGIYFHCTSFQNCNLTMVDSEFENNIAFEKGGAIHYTYRRPLLMNVSYSNNTAEYGPNISSYAVKITFAETGNDKMHLSNIGSGIVYEKTLNFSLRDYDNQVMVLNNVNQILILPLSSSRFTKWKQWVN